MLDKWSILQVKQTSLQSDEKVRHVRAEMEALEPLVEPLVEDDQIAEHVSQLQGINQDIWDLQEELRPMLEHPERDWPLFGRLCQEVILLNDQRARVKRAIDRFSGSGLLEEKSFSLED